MNFIVNSRKSLIGDIVDNVIALCYNTIYHLSNVSEYTIYE